MDKPYVVGIDVGGQTAKFGIVDARGNVLAQSFIRSDNTESAETFVDQLYQSLIVLIDQYGGVDAIRGIGVGAPNGNYYTGCIENAPNVAWANKDQTPLAELMQDRFGIPTAVTNDANAAAVGEMTYGAARGMKDFIMITLGTGVGSGIVIYGNVVYGHDGFAGELGHTTAVRHGRKCNCGKEGCLETYCSAMGVARTAREILELADKPSLLRNLPSEKITAKDVYEAAVAGDVVAKDIFDYTGKLLGESLADFVAFSAPEAIVLFGGLTRSGEYILNPVVEHMNANLLPLWRGKIKVIVSELKESDAAILGASALAWEL